MSFATNSAIKGSERSEWLSWAREHSKAVVSTLTVSGSNACSLNAPLPSRPSGYGMFVAFGLARALSQGFSLRDLGRVCPIPGTKNIFFDILIQTVASTH